MARVVILLVALVVAGYGLAGVLLHLVYADDPAAEQAACRYLVCTEDRLVEAAFQQMYRSGPENAAGALEGFREALRRDPASPDRWSELAPRPWRSTDSPSRPATATGRRWPWGRTPPRCACAPGISTSG